MRAHEQRVTTLGRAVRELDAVQASVAAGQPADRLLAHAYPTLASAAARRQAATFVPN